MLFADNVGDDCPVFEGLFEYCSISAGGSMGRYLPSPNSLLRRSAHAKRKQRVRRASRETSATSRSTGPAGCITRKRPRRAGSAMSMISCWVFLSF